MRMNPLAAVAVAGLVFVLGAWAIGRSVDMVQVQ